MDNIITINKDCFNDLDSFIEQVCERNHLYNYMGAINLAMENLLSIAKQSMRVEYSHYKDGICFTATIQDNAFLSITDNNDNQTSESVFIIQSLADDYNVCPSGDAVSLFFCVKGIEEELAIDRKQRIKAFSHHKIDILNQ